MPLTNALALAGHVTVLALANIRQGAPNRAAALLRKAPAGTLLAVQAVVVGETVSGNAHWYQLEANGFIWAGACGPLQQTAPTAPPPAPPPSPGAGDPQLAGFGLDPAFAAKLSTLLHACDDKGLVFKISQGLRTPQVQASYYCRWDQHPVADIDAKVAQLRARGAPWTADVLAAHRDEKRQKAWLTSALPGAGWHQWGEAADCYCYRDGAVVGRGDDPCYATYADLAQQIGLTAGLHFSKPDAGHVQLRPAGGATDIYSWSYIDGVMKARFGDKPSV